MKFSILDKLTDEPHLVSPSELRTFANEMEMNGSYQILAWRREAERGGHIIVEVTYEEPK